jgi:hypothetical protein
VKRPDLSAENILAVLNRHRVDYIVIGAFAAIAQRRSTRSHPRRDKYGSGIIRSA